MEYKYDYSKAFKDWADKKDEWDKYTYTKKSNIYDIDENVDDDTLRKMIEKLKQDYIKKFEGECIICEKGITYEEGDLPICEDCEKDAEGIIKKIKQIRKLKNL